MPKKVREMIKLIEADGWTYVGTTGSHRHFTHPTKPGIVTVAGRPSATLKPGTESEHPEASRTTDGARVRGYLVIFEGDDAEGYSAYSPDLPGFVAAAGTLPEIEHIALLREKGYPVPEPTEAAGVMLLDPPAA